MREERMNKGRILLDVSDQNTCPRGGGNKFSFFNFFSLLRDLWGKQTGKGMALNRILLKFIMIPVKSNTPCALDVTTVTFPTAEF